MTTITGAPLTMTVELTGAEGFTLNTVPFQLVKTWTDKVLIEALVDYASRSAETFPRKAERIEVLRSELDNRFYAK